MLEKDGCRTIENYFFDFDEIEHYTTAITDSEMMKLNRKGTAEETFQWAMLNYRIPESVKDTAFIPKLESIGFSKGCGHYSLFCNKRNVQVKTT